MSAHRSVRERVKARREEIVRKAAQAFRERGYHSTSIEDIAHQLNLTKASLYYYVHGKQALLFEAHRFAMQVLLSGLKEIHATDLLPRQKLERAIHHHIHAVVDELSLATMVLQQDYALSPSQRRKIIGMRDEYDALFRSIVRAGVAAGAFKAIDPKVIGFAIIGALNWMPHWFSQSGHLSKDEIGAMFADYLIGGLLADSRPGTRPADREGAQLFRVDGRVVVVTGAASGIGRAIAWGLARQGAHTVLVDRDGAGLDHVGRAIGEGGGEHETIAADVTRSADIDEVRGRALKRFGHIDGLVHAAGVAGARPFLEMDEAEWLRVLDVNLNGSFRMAHAVAGAMATRREGSIILISSIAARTGGQRGLAHYAASKAGVEGLARTLALELAPHGVRANAIAPGITETPIIDGLLSDDRRELMRKVIPLRRLARPQDYVGAATFLLSPASGYLTGQVLTVDGGLTMS